MCRSLAALKLSRTRHASTSRRTHAPRVDMSDSEFQICCAIQDWFSPPRPTHAAILNIVSGAVFLSFDHRYPSLSWTDLVVFRVSNASHDTQRHWQSAYYNRSRLSPLLLHLDQFIQSVHAIQDGIYVCLDPLRGRCLVLSNVFTPQASRSHCVVKFEQRELDMEECGVIPPFFTLTTASSSSEPLILCPNMQLPLAGLTVICLGLLLHAFNNRLSSAPGYISLCEGVPCAIPSYEEVERDILADQLESHIVDIRAMIDEYEELLRVARTLKLMIRSHTSEYVVSMGQPHNAAKD
ncbi:hypothetical protein NM688_g7104 [Phlebia brevispora]|uniref:Uncharacterized protein n=1 Tax=Phlebia brevispora TaxID=194682 RepID=A0ACC1S9A6_9APHY|nr:hypothetical protein NM688_g7104 [Phlebia brevispora]